MGSKVRIKEGPAEDEHRHIQKFPSDKSFAALKDGSNAPNLTKIKQYLRKLRQIFILFYCISTVSKGGEIRKIRI